MAFVGLDGAAGFDARPLHHPELLPPDDAVGAVARTQAVLYVAAVRDARTVTDHEFDYQNRAASGPRGGAHVKLERTRTEAFAMVPIETDDHVLRARRTAACTRAILGLTGIALALAQPGLLAHPDLAMVGFATISASATVQLTAPGLSWLKIEESLAGIAAVLIVGLGDQRVTVLSVLWLAAVASGVMARGGRVHWIGRTVVLGALALPAIRDGRLSADQAALMAAAIGLLLTSGRLTRELNHLLRRARWDADHDDLTGLLSRAAFRAALEEATARRGSPGRSRCCCSIWTALGWSTRRSGTRPGTRCSRPSASDCARPSARKVWWDGWEAMSSR